MMRRGVALLVTLVIVMLMTLVIGWSMQNLDRAKGVVEKERFLIQSGIIIEDVLSMLKNSPEINAVVEDNTSVALFTLLSSASMLPFESQGYRVLISLSSARGKLNINTLGENNTTRARQRVDYLANFLSSKGLNGDLVYYILDSMDGIKEDGSYRSDLFFNDPTLYRDAIVSSKQMERILLDYEKKEGIDPFSKLDFDKIFFYDQDRTTKLDLNYASAEVWEFVAGVTQERAKVLAQEAGMYQSLEDLGLTPEEKRLLEMFDYSFFEPVISVHIDVMKEKLNGTIEFEYDLKKKKAKRFVYEVQN